MSPVSGRPILAPCTLKLTLTGLATWALAAGVANATVVLPLLPPLWAPPLLPLSLLAQPATIRAMAAASTGSRVLARGMVDHLGWRAAGSEGALSCPQLPPSRADSPSSPPRRQHLPGAQPPGRSAGQRVLVQQAGPGVEDRHRLAVLDPAVAPQPRGGCQRDGAFRAHDHALGGAGQLHGGGDRPVGDRQRRPGGLSQRAQDQEVPERLGHAHARPTGAQPAACAATNRGSGEPAGSQPSPRSSWKPFHMPIRPTPPPVG